MGAGWNIEEMENHGTVSGAKPDRELIERGEAAGVHRCTFYIEPADAGETERQLDELASKLGLE